MVVFDYVWEVFICQFTNALFVDSQFAKFEDTWIRE